MIIVALATLGVCFGSFINAFTWRLHKKKDWVRARSQCTHCGHILNAADLVPILSWAWLRGRCRYCKKSISAQYPLVELAGGLTFVLSYIFWPRALDIFGELSLFITWLISSIGLLALLVYDFRYMLLPNKIIYPTLGVAVIGNILYLISTTASVDFLINWGISVLIASGIFWVLFVISSGKWIGYGDVRLGLITGTLLHNPSSSFMMIFLASVIGTVFILPSLMSGSAKLTQRLPFGPFLITATFICLLFGERISKWYLSLFDLY
jgi:prepilin signal peptidase PulO-like enzyme (type II secretory pathway)